MTNTLYQSIKLEIISIKERWLSYFLFFISPVIIIYIFFIAATSIVNWGVFAGLNLTIFDYLGDNIIGIVILFLSTQMVVLRIVGERSPYGTLDRELIAIPRISMYFGKLITNFVFVVLQIFFIYIFAFQILQIKNYANPIHLILFYVLLGLFGLVSGLAISIFSDSKEQAIQTVPFFIITLLILSGIIIPIDQMAASLKNVVSFLPLTAVLSALLKLRLSGLGFEDVFKELITISGWIIIILIIGLSKFLLEKRK